MSRRASLQLAGALGASMKAKAQPRRSEAMEARRWTREELERNGTLADMRALVADQGDLRREVSALRETMERMSADMGRVLQAVSHQGALLRPSNGSGDHSRKVRMPVQVMTVPHLH